MHQFVLLEVPTGDPHGAGGLPGGNNDPDPRMAASSHSTTTGVHHEAHQEPTVSYKWLDANGME